MATEAEKRVDEGATEHILSYRRLALVLGLLLVLTAVTIAVSRIDMGIFNIWIAILVASAKASLVVLFFMHMKYEARLLKMTFLGTIGCLALIISFIFWDISFR